MKDCFLTLERFEFTARKSSKAQNKRWLYAINRYSYKMIAAEMFIAIDTVRSHIRKIYEKLHVNSKSEAIAKAFKDKIV